MAQGDPFARLVSMMARQGGKANNYEMCRAVVSSVDPLAIVVNGVPIADHIYCNEITKSDRDEELAGILAEEEQISDALKQWIREMYEGQRVKPGDLVLVQRVKNSFLVIGKVVPI